MTLLPTPLSCISQEHLSYINPTSVRLYPEAPPMIFRDALATTAMTPSNTSPASQSIYIFSGHLNEFLQYSRQGASEWSIDLVHESWHLRSCQSPWFVASIEGAEPAVVSCCRHGSVNCIDVPLPSSRENYSPKIVFV
ncbi:hypothetical protein K443DRAFT_673122 [Laccaria amethystina LaAM-08-1]|uniref:Uncharacterized protein n=1 Tax=Laccaria amethystina LaAM-08-1 TaxID=1095629 RepID=A0A0C9X6Q7_9AGAR|nr:hypothetical protein K443DRAFT_673122 [Laccaria amethystina LaAM-08-1]